ncbi:hypothetical protein [Clostridium haemolyticum]|nr:hypothetical protein [Clostridium haemolyticum]
MMNKRKSKPVPFSDNEKQLLEWAENQDKPFATYIKDLIRKDMKESEFLSNKNMIKDVVKEVLGEMNFNAPIKVEKTETTKKKKKAIKGVLNSLNR